MNKMFSIRMVELRNERGISQKEAAQDLGISQALLSHYEKGIRECGLDFLCKAATYYDVSCDFLLGVIDTRHSFQEEFENVDLALDSEFRTSTLFRAATSLDNSISDIAAGKEKIIKEYFALAIYRLSIEAAKSGCIPKSWVNIQDDFSQTISQALSEKLLKDVSKVQSTKHIKGINEPVCIKTVISNAERIIEKETSTFVQKSFDSDKV